MHPGRAPSSRRTGCRTFSSNCSSPANGDGGSSSSPGDGAVSPPPPVAASIFLLRWWSSSGAVCPPPREAVLLLLRRPSAAPPPLLFFPGTPPPPLRLGCSFPMHPSCSTTAAMRPKGLSPTKHPLRQKFYQIYACKRIGHFQASGQKLSSDILESV